MATKKYKLPEGRALVLRCCKADFTSHNGFRWPSDVGAKVVAPDWSPEPSCGNGLHGWLYGQGDHSCTDYWQRDDAVWLVLEVVLNEVVMLEGKCKFPRAVICFIGGKTDAAAFLIAHEPNAWGVAVIGATLTVGDNQQVMVGTLGTATAGNSGTATAGDYGTATAGPWGEIRIRWFDVKNDRYRTAVGYIGENGLKPNVAYRLNDKHKFEEVKSS